MAGHAEYAKVAPVVNKSGKTFTRAEVAQHKKVPNAQEHKDVSGHGPDVASSGSALHSKETSGSSLTLPSSESASGSNIRHQPVQCQKS